MSYFALTVLLAAAALPEPVLLTPETVKEHDYYVECTIVSQRHAPQTENMVVVSLRFAPKRRGQYGLGAEDLEHIAKEALLVLHEHNTDKLSMPLRTEVDPGNYVHLHATFSVHKDLLPMLRLRFIDQDEKASRTYIADLQKFIEAK